MPNLGPQELILILVIVVLLFGAKRLPETARGLGRSLRIFKAETKGLADDEPAAAIEPAQPQAPAASTTHETPEESLKRLSERSHGDV